MLGLVFHWKPVDIIVQPRSYRLIPLIQTAICNKTLGVVGRQRVCYEKTAVLPTMDFSATRTL